MRTRDTSLMTRCTIRTSTGGGKNLKTTLILAKWSTEGGLRTEGSTGQTTNACGLRLIAVLVGGGLVRAKTAGHLNLTVVLNLSTGLEPIIGTGHLSRLLLEAAILSLSSMNASSSRRDGKGVVVVVGHPLVPTKVPVHLTEMSIMARWTSFTVVHHCRVGVPSSHPTVPDRTWSENQAFPCPHSKGTHDSKAWTPDTRPSIRDSKGWTIDCRPWIQGKIHDSQWTLDTRAMTSDSSKWAMADKVWTRDKLVLIFASNLWT